MTPVSPSTEPAAELLTQVADTRAAQDRAAAVHDQAIRDAATAGHPLTSIASTLGVTNRKRLYAVLGRPPADDPAPPPPTPVVFLRGAGATTSRWHDIETAMHTRGLNTVRDRQQAWNLARGGTPVILVDFSAGTRDITIGRVKARWTTTATTRPLAHLLPRAERERLAAEGATWLDTPVTAEDRHADLPLADPDATTRFQHQSIDPDQLAKAVITQLH
ncbi:MAG: hypothetical protein ACXWZL_01465 [Mycobacterium sp.]|jgi:hypothetical protein